MKRGTTPTLKIKVGITSISDVSQIEFILKQEPDENCSIFVKKLYPGDDVSYDTLSKTFYVSYTEEETRKFNPNAPIWLDTRITLTNGKIPATEIVNLYMNYTLFSAVDDD